MKEFLSRAGAVFKVLNVDEDEGAYEALLALRWRTVPVTIIGDRPIKGFDPDALRRALDGQL